MYYVCTEAISTNGEWSVCHNFLKRAGSFPSMLLLEHLFSNREWSWKGADRWWTLLAKLLGLQKSIEWSVWPPYVSLWETCSLDHCQHSQPKKYIFRRWEWELLKRFGEWDRQRLTLYIVYHLHILLISHVALDYCPNTKSCIFLTYYCNTWFLLRRRVASSSIFDFLREQKQLEENNLKLRTKTCGEI